MFTNVGGREVHKVEGEMMTSNGVNETGDLSTMQDENLFDGQIRREQIEFSAFLSAQSEV